MALDSYMNLLDIEKGPKLWCTDNIFFVYHDSVTQREKSKEFYHILQRKVIDEL